MTNETSVVEKVAVKERKKMRPWLVALLVLYVLATGAFLRFTGLDWDEDQH
ncbi:MAG: hypothetical protein GY869_09660, partial [Planctomycetes bacterium]|nr:hypothetical protein [Planctomycetota bacterium]